MKKALTGDTPRSHAHVACIIPSADICMVPSSSGLCIVLFLEVPERMMISHAFAQNSRATNIAHLPIIFRKSLLNHKHCIFANNFSQSPHIQSNKNLIQDKWWFVYLITVAGPTHEGEVTLVSPAAGGKRGGEKAPTWPFPFSCLHWGPHTSAENSSGGMHKNHLGGMLTPHHQYDATYKI